MKKTITLAFLLSFILMRSQLLMGDILPCDSRFYLGPEAYYGRLHVKDGKSPIAEAMGLSSNGSVDGLLYGFHGGYEYVRFLSLYANLDGRYGMGKVKGGHSVYHRYVHEYEINAVIGNQFTSCKWRCLFFTPYAGFGYQFQSLSISEANVKYRYRTYRIPVGFKVDFFCCPWEVSLDVKMLPQVDSTVEISGLKGANWKLGKRVDWEIALPVQYSLHNCTKLSLRAAPFWRYYQTGESSAKTRSGTELGLPSQNWMAAGLDLELLWTF